MKRKKPEKRVEGVLRRAHDLRRLRPCVLCGGVGLAEDLVAHKGALAHLSCYFETFGEKKFLALPPSDLRKVKASDAPVSVLQKLLKKLEKKG